MSGTLPVSLPVEPLTKEAFAPFGEVIERADAQRLLINEGTTVRFHDLAAVDVGRDGGHPLISIFRAEPRTAPIAIRMMERHPLGSQAFYPLTKQDWLVVVCRGHAAPDTATLRCFRASGEQGVNYRPNTWHHPLLVLQPQDFLVVDRGGSGENLDEHWFGAAEPTAVDFFVSG